MAPIVVSPVAVFSTNFHRRWSFKSIGSLQSLVLQEICSTLGITSAALDLNAGFVELGGHSISAVDLASVCKCQGIHLPVEDILLSNTIAELLGSAKWTANSPTNEEMPLSSTRSALKRPAEPALGPLTKRQQTSLHPHTALDSPLTGFQAPMTEMQLVFMQGSQANPGTNTISFYETYQTRDVSIMKRAWKTVIESEPIFRTTFDVAEDKATLIEHTYAQFSWEETMVRSQEDYENALEENGQSADVFTSF